MVRRLLLVILVSLALQSGLVVAQSADDNLLDGLRQRGLFDLARHLGTLLLGLSLPKAIWG